MHKCQIKWMSAGFQLICVWIIVMGFGSSAARPNDLPVREIQTLKQDPKGPFQAIQWYCPDGAVLPARDKCPTPGGLQHGRLKDWVSRLENESGIFLNVVLAGSDHGKVWDDPGAQSRLKQYALVQYLIQADQGWIYRKAQYYRGAVQAENESQWGSEFLNWLLSDASRLETRFFQLREACRVIPHFSGNKSRLQAIRTLSKTLSDLIPAFMAFRIKIHGQPGPEDLPAVREFVRENQAALTAQQVTLFNQLLEQMTVEYAVSPSDALTGLLAANSLRLPALSGSVDALAVSSNVLRKGTVRFSQKDPNPFRDMADLLVAIRSRLVDVKTKERLALMDVSLELEKILFVTVRNWQPDTLEELLEKCRVLVRAAAGAGYLEQWELAAVESRQTLPDQETIPFESFRLTSEQIRRTVDWGAAMIRSFYQPEITRFSVFEPLAQGFLDNRIRSSILLGLGEAAGWLTDIVSSDSGRILQLPGGMKPYGIRGLNPGLAFGILEVVDDPDGPVQTDPEKIYAFRTVPPELKPVAGILTLSEGNLVSHVQLLARNLGIPNAAISLDSLDGLRSYAGQRLFFAVSQKGGVVLKTEPDMTAEEKGLVQKTKRKQEQFRVPVEKMDLTRAEPVRLSRLRATDSGKLCGPKAANLGELKYLFPDYVGEGIVLPFGIFRQHLDQPMPGETTSYWSFLTHALSGDDETRRTAALTTLRSAIQTMPFLPGFETRLEELFTEAFGNGLGRVAVFIRSDTNMEDIREFTGAGLNLTVFNVRNREAVLQGIRDVWASPYSERSYLWRQKFLSNPENVFPSILLLPSVNVDRSGVVITHGIVSDSPGDITAAFSLGAGGAVEGQNAETYLMLAGGADLLLSPARERTFTRLPPEGGVEKVPALFHQPVLSDADRLKIRSLVDAVRKTLPGTPGIEGDGPFDIEMGFEKGQIRLFQVRPFVENQRAGKTNYLLDMDRQHTGPHTLSLKRKL